jgi:hypothetical protein
MADPVLLRSLACAALELYAMTDPLDVPMASVVRRARAWTPSALGDEHIDQELLFPSRMGQAPRAGGSARAALGAAGGVV